MAEVCCNDVLPVPPRGQKSTSKDLPPRDSRYEITSTELQQLMERRPYSEAHDVIQRHYGGITGLCQRLYTSPEKGISGSTDDVNHRQREYGTNTVPGQPPNTATFSVIRGAAIVDIPISDIVVGDICQVKTGDVVPADGVIIHCDDMKVDESELTGEAEYVLKGEDNCPLLLSGTEIKQGNGKMLVVAVGVCAQKDIKLPSDCL